MTSPAITIGPDATVPAAARLMNTHHWRRLPVTGERELDRIVTALNDAGRRLAEARRRADRLARQVATAERLAAIGRVAAGVAHAGSKPGVAGGSNAQTRAAATGGSHHRR